MLELAAAAFVAIGGLVSVLTLSASGQSAPWQKPAALVLLALVLVTLAFRPQGDTPEGESCGSGYMRHDC